MANKDTDSDTSPGTPTARKTKIKDWSKARAGDKIDSTEDGFDLGAAVSQLKAIDLELADDPDVPGGLVVATVSI
jgi:hypothetical protein